jgi:diaminohydroxyphosphoribosylaminopyrimidine deaminase/5-amino-6-(5-phosphoribosylamino)uracil reductase
VGTQDEKYMQAALRLARRGIGSVEPNPAVGAILVRAGQIIGKGWHRKFGAAHAEVNALADCKRLGTSPQGAIMYVTLEPCCHHAKTPPCTESIIAAGLAKVVVATIDPSQHACGKGIEKLSKAGIEVQTGVCETEAKLLNAPFIKFAKTGKSWVILKWAQTIDSKLAYAGASEQRRWISNELSRKDAHKLRRRVQGILVGINTVIADNPLLTPRPSRGRKPTRIVLDSSLRIPLDCQLIKTAKESPVVICTSESAVRASPKIAENLVREGAELLTYPEAQGRSNLQFLLDELSKRGIAQLLVEGGATVIASFLKKDLADQIVVYIAPKILSPQGSVDITEPMAELTEAIALHYVDTKRFGNDVRLTGLLQKALDEISA